MVAHRLWAMHADYQLAVGISGAADEFRSGKFFAMLCGGGVSMKDGEEWFVKSLMDGAFDGYRVVWELYLKFYTVFLTVNLVALGVTVQHIQVEARWPIVWAFILQNVVSLGTAVAVGMFSLSTTKRHDALLKQVIESSPENKKFESLAGCPVPGQLGGFCALANVASHVLLMVVWFAIMDIPVEQTEATPPGSAPVQAAAVEPGEGQPETRQ